MVMDIKKNIPLSLQCLSRYPILLHTLLYISYLVTKSSLSRTSHNLRINKMATYLEGEIHFFLIFLVHNENNYFLKKQTWAMVVLSCVSHPCTLIIQRWQRIDNPLISLKTFHVVVTKPTVFYSAYLIWCYIRLINLYNTNFTHILSYVIKLKCFKMFP